MSAGLLPEYNYTKQTSKVGFRTINTNKDNPHFGNPSTGMLNDNSLQNTAIRIRSNIIPDNYCSSCSDVIVIYGYMFNVHAMLMPILN